MLAGERSFLRLFYIKNRLILFLFMLIEASFPQIFCGLNLPKATQSINCGKKKIALLRGKIK
ncbi:hypothetical protein PL78_15015 [Yersinia entomophaga]|uniref:Uncharacterized protein n=1 Tax=Yersinia entomophaga TaxID=935293 RepID=A0ABM6BP30_YERET|nr:hypothetical protein PL78_15015 [Yersinia entomophaga]